MRVFFQNLTFISSDVLFVEGWKVFAMTELFTGDPSGPLVVVVAVVDATRTILS